MKRQPSRSLFFISFFTPINCILAFALFVASPFAFSSEPAQTHFELAASYNQGALSLKKPTQFEIDGLASEFQTNAQLREDTLKYGLSVILPDSMRENRAEIEAQLQEIAPVGTKVRIEFINWKETVQEAIADSMQPENINEQIDPMTQTPRYRLMKGLSNMLKNAREKDIAFWWETSKDKFNQTSDFAKDFGRMIKNSFQKPTQDEVIMGVVTKSVPLAFSLMNWGMEYTGNLPALLMASGLSIALDTLHGPFCATWNNLQYQLSRKGTAVQTLFNMTYGKFWEANFRMISYQAGVSKNSPLSFEFIGGSIFRDIVGGFFGTKGWQGVNRMAEKGVITFGQRNFILQIKDILMMAGGTLFTLGVDEKWMYVFATERLVDIGLYLTGHFAKQRASVIIAPKQMLEDPKFQELYPQVVKAEGYGSGWAAVRENLKKDAKEFPGVQTARGLLSDLKAVVQGSSPISCNQVFARK